MAAAAAAKAVAQDSFPRTRRSVMLSLGVRNSIITDQNGLATHRARSRLDHLDSTIPPRLDLCESTMTFAPIACLRRRRGTAGFREPQLDSAWLYSIRSTILQMCLPTFLCCRRCTTLPLPPPPPHRLSDPLLRHWTPCHDLTNVNHQICSEFGEAFSYHHP